MKKIAGCLILGLLSVSMSASATENRYASITHTQESFATQGYCSYEFSLDNGGSHMSLDNAGFGSLEITLQMKDKKGSVIGNEVLEVEPFGDIGANRSITASLAILCDDIGEFKVIKVVEDKNGRKVQLPLSIFEPMNPELAKMSVSESK
ncbi:IrmA family protein [Proteus hauseri]|uniref:IrmA family protein n=1 Tax=Proteus hauseri TaxID=183417 RepID=UPI0032DB5058